jgi:hypothetical protein
VFRHNALVATFTKELLELQRALWGHPVQKGMAVMIKNKDGYVGTK